MGNKIEITYLKKLIFQGRLNIDKSKLAINIVNDIDHNALTQVIKFTSRSDSSIIIKGWIAGSGQSFPCSSDRPMIAQQDIVRSVVGQSHSLLNRAVYDRKEDWVLSIDYFSSVKIDPQTVSDSNNSYQIDIKGSEVSIRFRPKYYKIHRGLEYFTPSTYDVWKPSVAGWCSWYAYMDDITEQKIRHTTDIISEKLHPYGFDFIQIDDGYQQDPIGFPDTWLHSNNKFPSGLKNLAQYILNKGMQPAIWSNVTFHDTKNANAHKDLFVLNEKGVPAEGRWIGNIIDGSNPEAINKIIRPVYKGLKEMGWHYFKVDALRHLRYEGYNSFANHFSKKHVDRVSAFRNVVKAIRQEVGKNNFMLGCWGIRPELIGLIDACRIGDDGFSWQEMAQYNSFNNLIWRNDPDHIQLGKNAYRDCMVTSMTGSLLMLTDKPERYETGDIEAAIRSSPVLFTLPGQLYDVDASRSINLNRVNTEMSGSGSRSFDASRTTPYDLFLQEINKPFENWMMLGRVGESRKYIPFSELGLDAKKNYVVFEFWTKTLAGIFTGGFMPGPIDTSLNCQLFCIREMQNHPQLLATNRHISCGAEELQQLQWQDHSLKGMSKIPNKEMYILYLNEPPEYRFISFNCSGGKFISTNKKGNIREITVKSSSNDFIKWEVFY